MPGPPQGMPNGTQVPFPGNAPNGMPLPGPAGQQPIPNQRRMANGAPPFQSPTMAHSPPNAPQAPGTGLVGANTPLTQMANARGTMPPPQQTPQPGFAQLGRSPSNPSSPANPMMTGRSPSLAPRQPPLVDLNQQFGQIPQQAMLKLKADIGAADRNVLSLSAEEKVRAL